MDADGEIAQLKGALTKMSKDYDEYVDLSTEVEEGLHGEVSTYVGRVSFLVHASHPSVVRDSLPYLPLLSDS